MGGGNNKNEKSSGNLGVKIKMQKQHILSFVHEGDICGSSGRRSGVYLLNKGMLCSEHSAFPCVCVSHVPLSVTPWSAARQAPLSMGFFRQEYWSGMPFPSPM